MGEKGHEGAGRYDAAAAAAAAAVTNREKKPNSERVSCIQEGVGGR